MSLSKFLVIITPTLKLDQSHAGLNLFGLKSYARINAYYKGPAPRPAY